MQRALVVLPAAAVFGLAAACSGADSTGAPAAGSSHSVATPVSSATSVAASRQTPLTSKQICRRVLGPDDLLDWASGTVGEFRSYQYGGPKPTVPLAHAFPGLPNRTRGAWCGTKAGAHRTHWWAAVDGHKPASLITINGPGEGVKHGAVDGPTRIP